MNNNSIFRIAGDALALEKLKIDTAAYNIAHQYSLQTSDTPLFKPLKVVDSAFKDQLSHTDTYASVELIPQSLPPNKVYQPSHPKADNLGYLTYPGISMVDEMTTVMQATRAYEANIKMINTAYALHLKALSIGEER